MRLRDRALFWDHVPASAHVGVGSPKFREAEKSARYVHDDNKAWTQAFYNPVSLSIEIEGFASQATWPRATVREVARWLALWSIRHSIPLHRGRVFAGVVVRRGVITHKSLGVLGGGHTDPGTFPVQDAIELARRIKTQRLAQK